MRIQTLHQLHQVKLIFTLIVTIENRKMDAQTLFYQFQSLPKNLQKQVEVFIQSLMVDNQLKETTQSKNNKQEPIVHRKAGTMKGLVLYMADDFDEPLEDFNEYM